MKVKQPAMQSARAFQVKLAPPTLALNVKRKRINIFYVNSLTTRNKQAFKDPEEI
jgi:hypothetical protein